MTILLSKHIDYGDKLNGKFYEVWNTGSVREMKLDRLCAEEMFSVVERNNTCWDDERCHGPTDTSGFLSIENCRALFKLLICLDDDLCMSRMLVKLCPQTGDSSLMTRSSYLPCSLVRIRRYPSHFLQRGPSTMCILFIQDISIITSC